MQKSRIDHHHKFPQTGNAPTASQRRDMHACVRVAVGTCTGCDQIHVESVRQVGSPDHCSSVRNNRHKPYARGVPATARENGFLLPGSRPFASTCLRLAHPPRAVFPLSPKQNGRPIVRAYHIFMPQPQNQPHSHQPPCVRVCVLRYVELHTALFWGPTLDRIVSLSLSLSPG